MNIVEIISVKPNGRSWEGQPEWECIVKMDNGEIWVWARCVQWTRPELHHLQDAFADRPGLFERASHQNQ